MMRFAYAILGRYTQLRASDANILTAQWVKRSFTFMSNTYRPQTVPAAVRPISHHLLRQAAMSFADDRSYVEVRFSHITRRSVLCYGESTLDGMLRDTMPTGMTFHAQDALSCGVMMGSTLVLYRVAVTITGFARRDGWVKIIETTLPCVMIEPDGRVITDS